MRLSCGENFEPIPATDMREISLDIPICETMPDRERRSRDDLNSFITLDTTALGKAQTQDSPSPLPRTDRIPNSDALPFKLPPQPYKHLNKAKKGFHTPFLGNFNQKLINEVNQNALYRLQEVQSKTLAATQIYQVYQIQKNEVKVESIRAKMQNIFEVYYKLLNVGKTSINYSVEVNKVSQLLKTIAAQIAAEQPYDYLNNSQEVLVLGAFETAVFNEFKTLLNPIIKSASQKLANVHKEFYSFDYFSARFDHLKESFNSLTQDMNETIIVVGRVKKNIERAIKFSDVKQKNFEKFDKVKKPHQLCDELIRLVTKMQLLKEETQILPEIKTLIQKYLKATVILTILGKDQEKLMAIDSRLVKAYNTLHKKIASLKSNKQFKQSFLGESQAFTSKFNIPQLIEGDCFTEKTFAHMKDFTKDMENYAIDIENYCASLSFEKDHNKIQQNYSEVDQRINELQKILESLKFFNEFVVRMKPIIEKPTHKRKDVDLIEEEVAQAYKNLKSQINVANFALDPNTCTSAAIAKSLDYAFDQHLSSSKKRKDVEKAHAYTKAQMHAKAAQIIRKRLKLKNDLFTMSYSRIQQSASVSDALELLKSKKLWQAFVSAESQVHTIRAVVKGKAANHKIYCNKQLEGCLLDTLRTFTISLSGIPPKRNI